MKTWAKQTQRGFTIVELLIVIVVIGILAAITIVAFNGVQNRANDTAIQNDLRNLATQIKAYQAEQDALPVFGNEPGDPDGNDFPGITFKPTKGAYGAGTNNLFVCKGQAAGGTAFGMAALSKSGNVVAYTSSQGFVSYAPAWDGGSGTICPALGFASFYRSFGKGGGTTWNSWIQ